MPKLKDDKITSYKTLVPELQKIVDELDKMGRGCIFATLPKDDEKGKELKPLVLIANKSESNIAALIEFWAGMMSLVEALNKEIPEKERSEWKESWLTFIQATNSLCFPSIFMKKVK